MDIIELENYIHAKSGKELLVVGFVKIKINGEWVDGIIYSESDEDGSDKLFARTIDDFRNCCQEVL